jgi:hypothetical protein
VDHPNLGNQQRAEPVTSPPVVLSYPEKSPKWLTLTNVTNVIQIIGAVVAVITFVLVYFYKLPGQ